MKKKLLKEEFEQIDTSNNKPIPEINKNTMRILQNKDNIRIDGQVFLNMNVEDRLIKMGSEMQTTIQTKRQFAEEQTF